MKKRFAVGDCLQLVVESVPIYAVTQSPGGRTQRKQVIVRALRDGDDSYTVRDARGETTYTLNVRGQNGSLFTTFPRPRKFEVNSVKPVACPRKRKASP
jgi:hypothetical protein